jgi:2-C-methyl-D-erythritol 2,4-cyclodiphosphate synthase
MMPEMRIGMGYDVHRLEIGRPLVLGGVTIPFNKGLLGHSDADVITHAICDALLGAAALGDLGRHFPDTSPEFKGIQSIELLKRCNALVGKQGHVLVNLDATLIAEAPKISPFRTRMQQVLADALDVAPALIGIKATTTEGLGYLGAGEGMAAMCVALVRRI